MAFNREACIHEIEQYLAEENLSERVYRFSNTLAGERNGWFVVFLKPGLVNMRNELHQRHIERKQRENENIPDEEETEQDEDNSNWKEIASKYTPEVVLKHRRLEDQWKEQKNLIRMRKQSNQNESMESESVEELSDVENNVVSDMEDFGFSSGNESW